MKEDCKPVFVLIRTSNRPAFFENCMKSVLEQDYPNIITIVHSDDDRDKYVCGDIIIRSPLKICDGPGYYNLYCNKLLEAIPENTDGWYHFLDDDDRYTDPETISKLVAAADPDAVNVGRSQRADGIIYPKNWKNQESFQTECFFLHTKHKNKATWWHNRAGDHNYSSQLTKILPINWIDNLIICTAQAGKGFGKRMDLDDQKKFYRKGGKRSVCGARGSRADYYFVHYLQDVKGDQRTQGSRGENRWIHKDYATILVGQGRIKVLKTNELQSDKPF
jgi:glycosyltransferase involved in cell wall biosynthesis